MSKTILVTVADDRQGRKDGAYGRTQDKISQICDGFINHHVADWAFMLNQKKYYNLPIHNSIDSGINGRCYKPIVISSLFHHLEEGDFLIYNDCSPELWNNVTIDGRFSLDVIHKLTEANNDILTSFVKWDCQPIPHNHYGIHIHKYFTTNRCMDVMGLRQYENSYQHASGMFCIRKTPETVKFVEEWLYWNLNPECASLGDPSIPGDTSYWTAEQEFKVGHRHDQSISGLLLNQRNVKLVDILHNEMNPYNFLQYCRVGHDYKFIDSNTPIQQRDLDFTKVFIRRGSKVRNEAGIELNVWRVDYVDGIERIIVGQYEESAWATTRDKITLV